MPYKIVKAEGKWCVYKQKNGKWSRIGPYYTSRVKALKYMRALYAHSPDIKHEGDELYKVLQGKK